MARSICGYVSEIVPKQRSIATEFGFIEVPKSSIGESPSGKAPDFDSGIRRFDPYLPSHFL